MKIFLRAGASVALLDCLDPNWMDINWPVPQKFGTGHYPKTRLPKPQALDHIPRNFSRYGLPYQTVKEALKDLKPRPDLILLTCLMTYWYPGAVAGARLLKSVWPKVPIVLGGVYATLCFKHAQGLPYIDLVVQGPLETEENWEKVWSLLDAPRPKLNKEYFFSPAIELYPEANFSIILGSRGCPFNCPYCASNLLYPGFTQADFKQIWPDIKCDLEAGIRDFAFYDDALLLWPEKWLLQLLERFAQDYPKVRLHTPNAMHPRFLSPEISHLFKKAGLTTIRLGLETADFQTRQDKKLAQSDWDYGLKSLFSAGFKPEQIGAYILFGLPGQKSEEILRSIEFARSYGIRPYLAFYSPIPGTKMFDQALDSSPYPLDQEPLFQNSSIWSCVPGGFSWKRQGFWKKKLAGK